MARPCALVIGGSVGGLFAANLLRTVGWDVTVFERADGDLGDRGAGVGTRPELFAVMRRIGLHTDASIGVEVSSRICLDRGGNIVHEVPTRAVTSSWARLWRPLKQALPDDCYRAGAELKRVEQDAESVTAIFADGTRAQGDLLIGADGIHSTVRQQFLPELEPAYAGYVAWRGVVTGQDVPAALHATVFHHMIFCFPPEGLMLSIPLPGPDGGRACNFVWFQLVDYDRTLPLLCTDESGHQHGYSIPPPLIQPRLISALKSTASALFAPQVAAVVAGTTQPILQPIFDLESPRLVFGRVALLGDAAFVARPHVATGVMKAALDAQGLADALAGGADLDAALMRYEHERRQFGSWLVARGRRIGASLAAQPQAERRAPLQQRAEVLLREYGAAGLVDNEPITARNFG